MKYKFAILGCGIIVKSHAAAVNNTEDAELYAVCDVNQENATAFAAKFNVKNIYTDYMEMLNDPEIDVISICVPSGMHGDASIAAARHGKHIICEKPMEITREKLDSMNDEIKKNNIKFGCVFQKRYMPQVAAVKQALESGRLGKIIIADAHLKYYRTPEYYKSAKWRGTWALDGGGVLMNQGIHGIDLLLWIAGDVDSVFAYCEAFSHDIQVEDTAVAVIKFRSGAFGVIEASTALNAEKSSVFQFDCEKGTLAFSDSEITMWKNNNDENEKAPELNISNAYNPGLNGAVAKNSHFEVYRDFTEALKNNRQPFIPASEGRKAVDIILEIYESARTGKEIRL
jgi:predicted dehydrogenase